MTTKRQLERRIDGMERDVQDDHHPIATAAYDPEHDLYLDTDGRVIEGVEGSMAIIPTDEQLDQLRANEDATTHEDGSVDMQWLADVLREEK